MILLFGNFLSIHGFNPTAIEELEKTLSSKYVVKSASHKRNSLLRLIDMFLLIINNRKSCRLMIVDVFGTRAFYYSCLVILIAKINQIPYLPVFRGGTLADRYNKSPELFKFLFQRCQTIICPSNYLADLFIEKNFPVKIIQNYIEIKKYKFKKRDVIKPNLIWVRSIHSIYNPLMAIQVLYEVRRKMPLAKLCMIGPEKDNSIDEMNRLINRLKLNNHVTITGKLAKKEWIDLSSKYDIFINTTNYDNHPISIIEAMALGLPIVSTNVGGIPNLLRHNETAKLVEANDVSAMASQIMDYLLNDDERIQISTNARKNVEKNYSKGKIVPKWFELIDENLK